MQEELHESISQVARVPVRGEMRTFDEEVILHGLDAAQVEAKGGELWANFALGIRIVVLGHLIAVVVPI